MEKEERDYENLELSESEEELDFNLYEDNLTTFTTADNASDYDTETSADSEIIVRPRRRIRVNESDSENASVEEDEWYDVTGCEKIPKRINFTVAPRITGPQISSSIIEPLEYFQLYFTEELVSEIIEETNNYSKRVLASKQITKYSIWQTWKDLDKDEFWAFIGIILNMGTISVANIQEYWSTNRSSEIPFFSSIFTRTRFSQIFWMLRLKTPNPVSRDVRNHVQRVNNFLEYINARFSEHFVPGENICICESIVKYEGKVCFITYNPNKPTEWGVRIHVLADSETGYVYNILPHYGNITSENLLWPDLPVTSRIPLHLYQKLLDRVPTAQGYQLHTDRYYTSIALADELLKMKCHLTGIIKTNRKDVPIVIKKPKFSGKRTLAYRKGNTMLLAWKDKTILTLLSNFHNGGCTPTRRFRRGSADIMLEKPNVVLSYTVSMGGVDRADQYASSYCFMKKSLKWWRKLFFWGMETSVINSYILYKTVKENRNETPLTHLKYIKVLVDQLVGNFRQERPRASTSTSISDIRLDGKLHVMYRGKKRDCIVCSKREQKGGRRETVDYCNTCPTKPRMHMGNCFERYHTMKKFKM